MKFTYLILLTLAIIACLASVADAGKGGKNRGVGKRGKNGKRNNAVGKGKGKNRGRNGGGKRKGVKADDEDEEDNKGGKKSRRGRGKGKGKKLRKRTKGKKGRGKGKKIRKGGRKNKKSKNERREKVRSKATGGKAGKKSYGKASQRAEERKKKKKAKGCKAFAERDLKGSTGDIEIIHKVVYPDGFFEVMKAAPMAGYTGGCEAWYCVGKNWEIKQYTCTTCENAGITYNVGQGFPVSATAANVCMVNPTNPQQPGVWKTIGVGGFPMSVTAMAAKAAEKAEDMTMDFYGQ